MGFTALSTVIFFLQLIVFGLQAKRLRQTINKMDEIERRNAADIRESIAASKRAAEAAELNAEALVNLESPIVVVTDISIPTFDPDKLPLEILPLIRIKNYGRTPAFVDNVLLNIAEHYAPRPRKYRKTNFHPDMFIIEPGRTYDYVESHLRYMPGVDLNIVKARIKSANQTSCVYGVIFYRDFMNRRFEKGFIRAFSKGPRNTENYSGVYPEYDYQREVEKYTEYP